MYRIVVSLVVLSALVGAPALAADLPIKSPPVLPPPVFSWTGWYLGGSAGFGLGNSGTVTPSATGIDLGVFGDGPRQLATVVPVINAPFNTDPRGPLGGIQFGYNQQISKFVWGFEADYSWANINGSGTRTGAGTVAFLNGSDVNVTTIGVNEQLKGFGTIRGRIGFTPTERSLLYATGGFAYGSASSNTTIGVVQTSGGIVGGGSTFTPLSGTGSKTLAGWTAGAGGEWAFAPHWSVKAEYLYYDLGQLSYSPGTIVLISGGTPTPFGNIPVSASARFNGSIARVGINYLFGGR